MSALQPTTRAGVYRVTHGPSGRTALGRSLNVDAFLNRLRFELQTGSHRQAHLQRDWNADGASTFTFEVLDELPPTPGAATRANLDDDLKELLTLWQEKLHIPPALRY